MALDFLSGIMPGDRPMPSGNSGGGIDAISGILGMLSGIKGENDVYKAYKNQGPTDSEARSTELLNALLDPENPMVKRMQQEETARSIEQFLSQIRGMTLSDRRRQGRGGQPTFFNPERADEAVDFLVSRARPRLDAQGLDAARNRISVAQQGFASNVGNERTRQEEAMNAMRTHTQYRTDAIKGLPQIFTQIQGLINPPQQQAPQGNWMDEAIYDY